MSAWPAVCNGISHENRRLTRCLGVSPTLGRAARGRRILDWGCGRLPRRRSAHRPTLGGRLPPAQFLWRWLKYDRLCNFAPRDAHHLNEAVVSELEPIWEDQTLLRSFFHQSDLPLPRALLS